MNNQNNNNNNNIYQNGVQTYQNNNSNNYQNSNMINGNNQSNQFYNNVNYDNNNKSKKVLKVVMMITLVLIVISLGGFALVYTGIIKIGYVEPESILLNAGMVGVRKGKEFQYDYQFYPERATNKNVYYVSSDPKIATVNEITGYVTPIKEGTVKITVKSKEDDKVIEDSILTVTKDKVPITGISLSSERIVFDLSNKNKSQLLKVNLEPYNATTQSLYFQSSNESVVLVDQGGRVTPVGFGVATIIVSAKDSNATSQCEVIVTDSANKKVYFEVPDKGKIVFPYSIQLDRSYLKLRYGESMKVGFTLLPPDVTEDVVTWISSNPSVATVKEGLVTGVAVGQTIITARTVNDLVATLTVDVSDEIKSPTNVEFFEENKNLEVGDSEMLSQTYDNNATIPDVEWKSSNNDAVIVDSSGNISAVGPGDATITATTPDGNEASMDVTVNAENTDTETFLQISDSEITLEVGTAKTLDVASNYDLNKLNYQSSNENVASVNERGLLIAKNPGEAIITISTVDGLSGEIKVNVINVEATKILIATDNTIEVGDTKELLVEVYPSNATNKKITYQSSNNAILSVDQGIITAKSPGKATITASIGNLKNELEINIVNKIDSSEREKSEELIQNNILNDEEINRLKSLSLTEDLEYKDANKKLYKLELDKYGFSSYVNLEKITYEIDKEKISKTITKAQVILPEDDKELSLGSIYTTYSGYGSFEIKTIVTLYDGRVVELTPTIVTIHPVGGVLTNGTQSGGTGTDGAAKTQNYSTSISMHIDNGKSKSLEFNNYQDVAKQVTNWKSSDSSVVSVTSQGTITARKAGGAIITGSLTLNSNTYNFMANVSVAGGLAQQTLNATLNYGECYSAASLCPNGGVLVSSTISKNASKCVASRPYYVDKLNYTYTNVCKYGNVSERKYLAKSGSSFINDSNLTFSVATGTSYKPGDTITISITNWTQLGLSSIKYSAPGNVGKTTTTGIATITIPKNQAKGNYHINFTAGKDNRGRVYSGTLVVLVIEPTTVDSLICSDFAVEVNQSYNLSCDVLYSDGKRAKLTNAKYQVLSGQGNISIDSLGKVTGKNKGSAVIRVNGEGKDVAVKVTINNSPVYKSLNLTLNKSNTSSLSNEISINERPTISYAATDTEGNIKTSGLKVNYTSTCAFMSGNVVTPKVTGICEIKGHLTNPTGADGVDASILIKVVEEGNLSQSIQQIGCPALSVTVGATEKLACQMLDSANKKFVSITDATYKSGNTSIATVNSKTGEVTGKMVGNTDITVIAHGKTTTAKVKVEAAAPVYDQFQLKASSQNIEINQATTISYVATDSKTKASTTAGLKVSVSSNSGVVWEDSGSSTSNRWVFKGRADGIAAITGTYTDSLGEKHSSTVYVRVTSSKIDENIVRIACSPLTLSVGSSQGLSCKMADKAHEDMVVLTDATFTSNDTSIATVSSNGTVTGKKAGKTTISVKAHGQTTSVSVTVNGAESKPKSISLNVASSNIILGGSSAYTYLITYTDGKTSSYSKNVSVTSSQSSVATISGSKIVGSKEGSARITVTYNDGKTTLTASADVNVAGVKNKTCYRYKAVTGTTYEACGSGKHRAGTTNKCYIKLSGVTSSLVCGYKYSSTKWWNGGCYQYASTSKKVTKYSTSYSYTSSESTAKKGKYNASTDTLKCKDTCSADACS